jgi:hypothetical protein
MYRLQLFQADTWSLLDERDEEVFRGSLSECESWLDRQENQTPHRRQTAFADFNLRDWIHRIWAGAPAVPIQCSTPGVSDSAKHGA